jgi:predicted permease
MRLRQRLARCTSLFTRRRTETRLDEEIQSHLDALADEYEARGMSPGDARRAARRAFGGVMQMKEAHREQRSFFAVGTFDALARDGRRAVRRALATPGATLFSIATLAAAIGVTTATYSVLLGLIGGTPRAIREPMTLVRLSDAQSRLSQPISTSDYRDLRDEQRSLAGVAASATFATSLIARGSSSMVAVELVSGTYFQTIGATAQLGRLLGPADDRAGAAAALVLTDAAWRTRFAGDPSIVGSAVAIAGRPFTVVGVCEPGFSGLLTMTPGAGPNVGAAFWIPLSAADDVMGTFGPSARSPSSPDARPWLRVIGRLRAGTSIRQAAEDVAVVARRLDLERPLKPVDNIDGPTLAATRSWGLAQIFAAPETTQMREMRRIILLLPALVLLIACTNLTNLSLSRGMSRRRTFAVRRALGASRWRLVREELLEGAIVALAGGVAALGLARVLLTTAVGALIGPATVAAAPLLSFDFPLSPAVLAFAAGATALALVVGTLAPALQLSRTSVAHALGRDVDTATPRWRGRRNLIALQVGASVGLVLVAFASMTFVQRTPAVTRGPSLDRVAAAGIPFDWQRYDEARARETLDRALREIRRVPGVTAAGVVSNLRGTEPGALRSYSRYAVATPDRPFTSDNNGVSLDATIVSADAFQAIALPIVSGRAFDDTDTSSSAPVVIVNEAMARAWPNGTALPGRPLQIRRSSPLEPTTMSTARIVGVVADGGDPARGADARIYLPFAQAYEPSVVVLASARAGADPPVAALRAALHRADPNLAAQYVELGSMLIGTAQRLRRSLAIAASSLAALALLFAMTGLYGVLSHVVTHRTREMAIRAALGADRRAIATMVLRDGLRPVAEGLVIGLGVATVIRTIMQMTVARGLSPIDALAFGLAAVVLIAAALAACWLPASRATKVDPNIALRDL